MKKFVIDTLAMVTFSWVVGMIVEIFISGLTLGQSLQSRVTGTLANVLTGGIYGKFHDWLFKITNTTNKNQIREFIVGTIAFVLFQVPLYVLILLSTGATVSQITIATATITVTSIFSGGPYEWFLTKIRHFFKVS